MHDNVYRVFTIGSSACDPPISVVLLCRYLDFVAQLSAIFLVLAIKITHKTRPLFTIFFLREKNNNCIVFLKPSCPGYRHHFTPSQIAVLRHQRFTKDSARVVRLKGQCNVQCDSMSGGLNLSVTYKLFGREKGKDFV